MDDHELRACMHRIMAGRLRVAAAAHDAAAAVAMTVKAMKEFVAVLRAGEARDIAEHPDLAELNVQLDGYYGDRS